MPAYVYKKANGVHVTIVMSIAQMEAQQDKNGCLTVDGEKLTRDIPAEHNGFAHKPGNWPMKSDAAGVAPSQVQEAYEKSVKDGVPTQFTPDGRAIFTSAGHRKRYCESVGLYDRNGGYRDPQRRNG